MHCSFIVLVTALIVSPISILIWIWRENRIRMEKKMTVVEDIKNACQSLREKLGEPRHHPSNESEEEVLKLCYQALLKAEEHVRITEKGLKDCGRPAPFIVTHLHMADKRLARAKALFHVVSSGMVTNQ